MSCEPWDYDGTCVPAGWPNAGDITARLTAMTPRQRTSYDMAVQVLNSLTLGQFGLCELTLRPCRQSCALGAGYLLGRGGMFTPLLYGGNVYNTCGCGPQIACGCGDSRATVLLSGPVDAVTEVLVDGVVVPPASYRVDNRALLVRTDGGVWPLTQNLNAPATEPGTFAVTYWRGLRLPAGGRRAVSALMVEFDKARCGDGTCRLPDRVTSVVREGVTYTMLDDPTQLFDRGRTGLNDVDMWLAAVNPSGARTRMRVWSPETANRGRVTS